MESQYFILVIFYSFPCHGCCFIKYSEKIAAQCDKLALTTLITDKYRMKERMKNALSILGCRCWIFFHLFFSDDEVCALNFRWAFKTKHTCTNEFPSIPSWEQNICSSIKNSISDFFSYFMSSWLLMLFFHSDLFIRLENEHAKALQQWCEVNFHARIIITIAVRSFKFQSITRLSKNPFRIFPKLYHHQVVLYSW